MRITQGCRVTRLQSRKSKNIVSINILRLYCVSCLGCVLFAYFAFLHVHSEESLFNQLCLLPSYLDSPVVCLSPAPRSLWLAFVTEHYSPHLRYDNQLISQRSPFPRGSFVCKILTLIWHVDIIKLMKCNCNEQVRHSICSGTLNEKDPSLLTC